MTTDLQNLLDMGFPADRAEYAVKKTGNLNGALQWLEDNQDKDFEEIKAADTTGASATVGDASTSASAEEPVANSLVCDDCGKKFKNADSAQFHAVKAGHENFSQSTEEIKPLTDEEKKAKLEELRQMAAARKVAQEVKDKEAAKKNEKIRMKSTQEIQHIKEELEKKERLKEAADKRKEKIADKEAKERIQTKIAADKEERRLKAEKAKAEREGRVIAEAPVAAPPAPKASTATEARLRLQTANGNLVKTYPAETTLFEVAQAIEGEVGGPVESFTSTYPKKVYSGAVDFGKTLKEAGLVPSAVLIVE